jgi:pyruvate/2-oxoglutarate dehydrogenase complex dihydrolipoamide acyltransferase (E2) component
MHVMGTGERFLKGTVWTGLLGWDAVTHPISLGATVLLSAKFGEWEQRRIERLYRGEIKQWFVEPGDTVVKGQLLAIIKSLKPLRGVADESDVRAHCDGVVVWQIAPTETVGWSTQVVEVAERRPPPGTRRNHADTGRAVAAVTARFARKAAKAANRLASAAEAAAAQRLGDSREARSDPDLPESTDPRRLQ